MATVQRNGKVKTQKGGGLFAEKAEAVDRALLCAARHAVLEHKRAGRPVVTWKDGRVAVVPAGQVTVAASPAKVRK